MFFCCIVSAFSGRFLLDYFVLYPKCWKIFSNIWMSHGCSVIFKSEALEKRDWNLYVLGQRLSKGEGLLPWRVTWGDAAFISGDHYVSVFTGLFYSTYARWDFVLHFRHEYFINSISYFTYTTTRRKYLGNLHGKYLKLCNKYGDN